MNGPLFDCYVLAPERTADIAMAFLDRLLRDRVAQFEACDPSDVLGVPRGKSIRDVASFLEANPSVAYSMYWRHRTDDPPWFATLAFTADAHLILGLSPCIDDDPECAARTVGEMMAAVGAACGYTAVESAPALNREEFLRKGATQPEAGRHDWRPGN
jgi:hypothetical protein